MAWNDEQRPVLPLLCDQSQATLTLQTAETRVGVQIIPAASSSKTAAADGSAVPADPAALTAALLSASCDYSVLITVLEGSVALQFPTAEPLSLTAGTQAEWQVLD
ncbi:MAG: hypothetical protein ACKPHU_03335, partial [Planctomycetaceae bacterium]